MQRFVRTLSWFTLFAALFYIGGVIVWGRYVPHQLTKNLNYLIGAYGHMNPRIKEVRQIQNVDILFLGSSHAYRGFDTRIFEAHGITSFNLGSSNQTPIQTKALLERYLDRIRPKLVIYEVYPATFANDGVESSLDIIANDVIDLNTLVWVADIHHIKTYNTLIYGLYDQWFGIKSTFDQALKRKDDTYIPGGYVEKELRFNPDTLRRESHHWVLRDDQLAAFGAALELIAARNIEYILVQAPTTSTLYQSYNNNSAIDSILGSFGSYKNFNASIALSDTLDFYDADHLNLNGVRKFNEVLIERLRNDGKLDFAYDGRPEQ